MSDMHRLDMNGSEIYGIMSVLTVTVKGLNSWEACIWIPFSINYKHNRLSINRKHGLINIYNRLQISDLTVREM